MKKMNVTCVRTAMAVAMMSLALTACDRTTNTPNPTTGSPTSGQPASTPATSSGGLSGSPTGTEHASGTGGTTVTTTGSGTTGAAPAESARLGSPSGATGSSGVTSTTGAAAATDASGGGASRSADTQDARTGGTGTGETASTRGGSAAVGVPDPELAPHAPPDRSAGSSATVDSAGGHTGQGTVAGLPAPSGSGQDASGAMSGGTGAPLEGRETDRAAAPGRDATGTQAGGDGMHQSRTAPLTRGEHNFLTNAAASGNFELAMAKLATERGQSAEVTRYAQMLIEHHTQANQQLMSLAQQLGVILPSNQVPAERRAWVDRLSKARQEDFDRLFVQTAGLQAHREDIALFERAAQAAQHPQVKAFAEKTLPLLRQHLEAARKLPGAAEQRSNSAPPAGSTSGNRS